MSPLVSVITPTWDRHDLLLSRSIPSVRAQTWPAVEHVIVSDGPDPYLRERLASLPVVYAELPEHSEGLVDYGSRARNHGLGLASGQIVAYLDDDNAYRAGHLALLVDALQQDPAADFAYSQMLRHPAGDIIGDTQPRYGGIDTSLIMHRRGLPQRCGMWPLPDEIDGDRHAPDWGVVSRWLAAGARWTRVVEVTVDYWLPP